MKKSIRIQLTRFIFSLSISVLFPFALSAQHTIVRGKIIDPLTKEPVPFAAIIFVGTPSGTTSDIDGKFELSTHLPADSIRVSFVGYLTETLPVRRGKVQEMEIALRQNKFDLPEVVIRAGENPALILMRKVQEHKPDNDREGLNSFQYEVYNKLEFDINNITEKFRNKKLFRPFDFIFDYTDTNATNQKPFLPVFLSETVSEVYFKNNPKQKKEVIKASKVSGVENQTVNQYLGDLYSNINIYDNYIYLFGKGFVSPLAGLSQIYYKYMLMDSAFIENKWCYKITFFPRRKQELTFNGDIWVHDTTFAIRKLNMRISPDANINFIEDLAVVQDYCHVADMQWMLQKEVLVVNLAPTETKSKVTTGFIGRKTTYYRNFILNSPLPDSFYKGTEIDFQENSTSKSDEYWDGARGEDLSDNEKRIYAMIDTIKTIPAYKRYANVVRVLATGYTEAGLFEIGPVYKFISANEVEGLRLRFGGQTGNNFSTKLVLGGYAAYGIKDKKYKHGAEARFFTSKQPRQYLGLEYKNDVEQLGKSPNAFADDNVFATVLRRNPSDKLNDVIRQKAYFEHEWIPGLSTRIMLMHSEYNPLGNLDFTYYLNDGRSDSSRTLNNSEFCLHVRFAYKERFVSGKVDRISLGTKYPVLNLLYSRGMRDILNSTFEYDKLMFRVEDNLYLGNFGLFSFSMEIGKIFQPLPYPLLFIHPGNNSFVYDRTAFNLMNYYEFVSDEYMSFKAEHHFGGIFLDRIPALRKLKWREVASISAVTGRLSSKNRELLADPGAFSNLGRKPYVEMSVGVENIFKILRVDNVWRLSYLENQNVTRVALMGTISIAF
ncbi:MAG: carboxypeptidase-like regulatory domain-containing protein [Bacteroidetes bacterium]|nr:MAG: carboxypeptidase-like regulatory domain-containing protein [Bacteroidota bacterium]REK06630.1 MAG: carboxypeptidase-like regulatory domain-containing protein [Bacteroidota bacterium]REK33396.1 MAG: carboxypeptidase-like regulatory domain-containing protein [Bacteroidota bacterium]REK49795.1 MAG: carboxypeptidase-like regulatory domain-containing protein [Bacteroidota bacterium]